MDETIISKWKALLKWQGFKLDRIDIEETQETQSDKSEVFYFLRSWIIYTKIRWAESSHKGTLWSIC